MRDFALVHAVALLFGVLIVSAPAGTDVSVFFQMYAQFNFANFEGRGFLEKYFENVLNDYFLHSDV
jgi:hypothetical protein